MRLYNSGARVMAAVARKLSVYVRRILRRPEVRVMSALILAISGNECSGQKSQITIISCGNAIGETVSPYIILAAKQLNDLWMKDEVPGSRYAVSDNGWI